MTDPAGPGARADDEPAGDAEEGAPRSPWTAALLGVCALLLFLAALRLIGNATDAATTDARAWLQRLVDGRLSAVGAGWLLTYGFTNGSVVAALGVSLGAAGVADPARTMLIVAGSRLGAAAFVILVGGMDYARRRGALRSALGLGVVTFVISHAVYIPATVGAVLALPFLAPPLEEVAGALDLGFIQPGFLHDVAAAATSALGPLPVVLVGIAILFVSVRLFDRATKILDPATFREQVTLDRPWLAFGVGAGVTLLTASISFSVGALVPLYNRGVVRRVEVAPYILGANVATLADTLLVALVVGTGPSAAAIMALILTATTVSLVALLLHRWSLPLLDRVVEGIGRSRLGFGAFLLSLALGPVLLLLLD